MHILVTGGAGFIGSNFARYWSETHPEDKVVALDALTYAGNRPNIADLEPGVGFVQADIADTDAMTKALADNKIDVVVNFAAESLSLIHI